MNKDIELDQSLSYEDAGLNKYLIRCYQSLKFNRPTPIQYYSIKTYQSQHQSIVAQSKSGTGKTLSYISIILTHILNQNPLQNCCNYLIVLPTRELALQVYQNFKEIVNTFTHVKAENEEQKATRHKLKQIKLLMSIGGIPFEDDRKKYLQSGGNVVVGTIGRILEFTDKKLIKINELKMIVLDEGDKIFECKNRRFTEMLEQIMNIKSQNQYKVEFLLYSATFTSKLLEEITNKRKYVFIQTLVDHNGALNVNITSNTKDLSLIETANDIEHTNDSLINLENIKKYKVLINLENNSFFNAKTAVLIHILQELSYLRCLIFVEKKTLLEQINERLIQAKLDALLIHGSLSQSSRIKLMNQINQTKIILASDLLARGIDIELDLVILFDAKNNDNFWHRIGRTGRYNKMGVAISLDNIENWQEYERQAVQNNLNEIELTFNKSKEFYGKYLTEIGTWNEATLEKEIEFNQEYKYFDEQKFNRKAKARNLKENTQEEVVNTHCKQRQMHPIDHSLDDLSKIKSENDLKIFLDRFSKCNDCKSFINSIEEMTGYQFQIKKLMNEELK